MLKAEELAESRFQTNSSNGLSSNVLLDCPHHFPQHKREEKDIFKLRISTTHRKVKRPWLSLIINGKRCHELPGGCPSKRTAIAQQKTGRVSSGGMTGALKRDVPK